MKKFKVDVAKWQKKYSLVFHAENDKDARERVHKEWYSILSINEIWDENIKWNKYIFEGIKDWDFKKWKVIWEDIFKVYVKLIDSLGYNISYIYPENEINITEDEKKQILKDLKEQYFLNNNKKETKLDKVRQQTNKEKKKNKELEHFYLKKELDKVYALNNHILQKIKKIIDWKEDLWLTSEQKEKLKTIYNDIVKLKKTTNLSKLKEIWEIALIKIGQLELRKLEEDKKESTRNLLKDTNKTLRKLWSKERFIEKNRDIKYIFSNFFIIAKEKIEKIKNSAKKTEKIDKETFSYLKNVLLFKKYKKRLKQNTLNLFKNFYIFILPLKKFEEKKENLLLKRKVIKQNIFILKKKVKREIISYTKVKNWAEYVYKKVEKIINIIEKISFKVIWFYIMLFILYLNYGFYFTENAIINFKWLFYITLLIILYFITSFSKWLKTLSISFVFLYFIVIFWLVNF